MDFLIPTRSGMKRLSSKALERLLADKKVPGGFTVTCASSGRRLPIAEAISQGNAPTTAAKRTGRGALLPFAGSALIAFVLCLVGVAANGRAGGVADVVMGGIVGMLFCLVVATPTALLFDAGSTGGRQGGRRFGIFLFGSTAVAGILLVWILASNRKEDSVAPAIAVSPPAPVAFDADRFEVTPAAGWTQSERLPGDIEAIKFEQFWSLSWLGIVVVKKQGSETLPSMDAFTAELPERLPGLSIRQTWGPESIARSNLPGLRVGFSTVVNGRPKDGLFALLSGKDAFLGVVTWMPASRFADRRAEVDAMIASIRER